jgi:transcriptional regulator with XRE-family HTH domain
MKWFGPRVGLEWVMGLPDGRTPAGESCLYCQEQIVHGDAGVHLSHVRAGDDGRWIQEPAVAHFACQLRQMVGSVAHLRRRCSCYVPGGNEHDDPALSMRENALAAAAVFLQDAQLIDHGELGLRLRRARVAAQVPRREACKMIGVSPSTYARIEAGERPLKGDELVLLADRFGVRADVITGTLSSYDDAHDDDDVHDDADSGMAPATDDPAADDLDEDAPLFPADFGKPVSKEASDEAFARLQERGRAGYFDYLLDYEREEKARRRAAIAELAKDIDEDTPPDEVIQTR